MPFFFIFFPVLAGFFLHIGGDEKSNSQRINTALKFYINADVKKHVHECGNILFLTFSKLN